MDPDRKLVRVVTSQLPPTPTQEENDLLRLGLMHIDDKAGAPPAAAPSVVDVPYLGGTGAVGEILTCTKGNWQGEPTAFAYAWKSGAAAVGGPGDTYTVAESDAGKSITCVVTATNAAGSTVAPPSNAVPIAATARSVPRPA